MRLGEVAAGSATIAIREWGDPAGRPFLFWHSLGPGSTGATIAVATEPLAAAGYRVIAPDAPGFGASPELSAETYTADRLASLLWEIADAVGVERVVVGGHSWGGTIGMIAAAARPERTQALVLFDSGHADFADLPTADLTSTREELIAVAEENSEVASWDELVELLRAEGLDQPWTHEAWRAAVVEESDGRVRVRAGAAARGAAMYEALRAKPSASWPAIGAAGIPTLLVLATEPAEARDTNERLLPRFLAAVPQAEVVRPGCRHAVFADLGSHAGTIVADWLEAEGLA
jgi:pimeloyl-ACP methyl ester carboxylesterase